MNEVNEPVAEQSSFSRALDSIDLKVKFDSGASARSKVLFGNGRMQVKVQVLVSGYDESGDYISVPADVLNTVELIHYNTGKTLRDGWNASTEQGRFTLEAPVSADSMDASDDESEQQVQPQVRTFWVSSAGVGTSQVAARISLNGTIIRSNGTGLSGRHDSSVTLEAQLPVTYSVDQFRWTSTRRGNEEPGNRIRNYYLGLYPQGQQIKLVDWSSSYGTDNVEFVRGNKLYATKTNYLSGFLVRPDKREMSLSLPYDGDPIAYTFFPDAITTKTKHYVVRVNDRDGELTVVQALSEYSDLSRKSIADGTFNFSIYDQYGTEHKLAIRTDAEERSFTLGRG
ncbi:hypothetical protein [Pseudomonas sp. HS6]|uniref:hypothetical protein n=1 Tax=Pseudomonas sp. HS6 TaxID=2850559 RepID=UPI002019EFEF|nr:hypothetical protein [Pseudomonas sp. HS6]UQS12712.1 hypothetical protein JJN09_15900 [Pseudomonas sp. HS6]